MKQRIAPSAHLAARLDALLVEGIAVGEQLAGLGRLSARFVLQRAVEDEVAAFLGRARYERTDQAQGWRNGHRVRRIQTAEGELAVAMPQVRGTLERFVSRIIPDTRAIIRTRPLEALVIGGYVRGRSDRDIASLAEEAGLGPLPRSCFSGRRSARPRSPRGHRR